MSDPSIDHEYLPITGLAEFTSAAARLILGADSSTIKEKRVVSVQTISGTGANHLGALFLSRFYAFNGPKQVYLSDPTWGTSWFTSQRVGYRLMLPFRFHSKPLRHLQERWNRSSHLQVLRPQDHRSCLQRIPRYPFLRSGPFHLPPPCLCPQPDWCRSHPGTMGPDRRRDVAEGPLRLLRLRLSGVRQR